MDVKIHCKYDELCDPRTLADYPRNPNKHANDQIERLAELYAFHGIRHPIIVDEERKVIAAGHGRKLAAIRAGIKLFPVVYQKFESDEALYAFITSDNAIAEWAELDMAMVNAELPNLGPDFDINMLGLKNFTLDPSEEAAADALPNQYIITIECSGESEMNTLYEEFRNRGLACKLIT